MKTWSAPAIAVWAVKRTIITRSDGCRPIVVKPASASAIVDASTSLVAALSSDTDEKDEEPRRRQERRDEKHELRC